MANNLFTETLAKYIAGITDADGSLYITAAKHGDTFIPTIAYKIVQADSIDFNFKNITFMRNAVGFGSLNYTPPKGNKAALCEWKIRARNELELFLPHIIKHLVIKGKHFKRIFDWWRSIRGASYSQQELTWFRKNLKQSRTDTGPLKPKNYPSAAWLAGYMDGDGCLHLGKRQKLFTISFHKDDIIAPELIQRAFGGQIYTGCWKKNPNVYAYRLTLGGMQKLNASGLKLLHYVLPHLKIKKHNAEQMLAMHQQRLNEEAPTGEVIV